MNKKAMTRYYFKPFIVVMPLLCMLILLSSCKKDQDDIEFRYTFGITSAINSNRSEIEAIELAYSDAFKQEGLIFDSQAFAFGTSKQTILKACKEAEDAIQTSSVKFEGRYVYEVKNGQMSIYHKVYGVRK